MARTKLFKSIGVFILVFFLQGRVNLFAQEISYGTGNWDRKELGNHRAVIKVMQDSDAVWIHVPWRREDNPEKKAIIIIDASTGKRVENFYRVTANREYGDFIFQPSTGKGNYYLYY